MFVRILIVAFIATLLTWSALTRTSEGAAQRREYVVQRSDTLWSIATQNYGGDPRAAIWRIEQANDLHGRFLRPGELLLLP